MKYRTTHWVWLILLVALPALSASAAPSIEMNVATEREVVDAERGVIERLPVQQAEPGSELIYKISYSNKGDEDAADVVIQNAIPSGVVFLRDMAPTAAPATFSIDGGATFAPADQLTYQVELADGTTTTRVAGPERYTHVRWVIDRVEQGGEGAVDFKVRVK